MSLNILTDPIFPVYRRDQPIRHYVSLAELVDADIVDFAPDRPDFKGSYAQLAIGLYQLLHADLISYMAWHRLFVTPPTSEHIKTLCTVWLPHFELMADGARFMQDPVLSTVDAKDSEYNSISGLLIESAGDSGIKKNTDLFIKRSPDKQICPCCAAITLFNLQTNAPAGGAGHRTGLRGGGPLTTLLQYQHPTEPTSLWHSLWLNVRTASQWNAHQQPLQPINLNVLPWLNDLSLVQKKDGETSPEKVHPSHNLFGMPRRIRLDTTKLSQGHCDLCGLLSEQLISRYLTSPYGWNYKGVWRHPFSPYYGEKGKIDSFLPMHPQPNGLTWKYWAGWVIGQVDGKKEIKPADNVSEKIASCHEYEDIEVQQLRLWVFGFDMENMKARCYYQTYFPMIDFSGLDDAQQRSLNAYVDQVIKSAELMLSTLKFAVKTAWFGEVDAAGDLSRVDMAFWNATQQDFFAMMSDLHRSLLAKQPVEAVLNKWFDRLYQISKSLYHHNFVAEQQMVCSEPKRVVKGWRILEGLKTKNKIRALLNLAPIEIKTPAKAE